MDKQDVAHPIELGSSREETPLPRMLHAQQVLSPSIRPTPAQKETAPMARFDNFAKGRRRALEHIDGARPHKRIQLASPRPDDPVMPSRAARTTNAEPALAPRAPSAARAPRVAPARRGFLRDGSTGDQGPAIFIVSAYTLMTAWVSWH